MAFSFPQFNQPTPLDGRRSWTATFDSYDQRNDDAYYAIALREGEHEVGRFLVAIGLSWAGDDWSSPDFVDRLRAELHAAAKRGRSNTDYQGQ